MLYPKLQSKTCSIYSLPILTDTIRFPGTQAPSWAHTCLFSFSCIPFWSEERACWLYLQDAPKTQSLLATSAIACGPNHLHPCTWITGPPKGLPTLLLRQYICSPHGSQRGAKLARTPAVVPYLIRVKIQSPPNFPHGLEGLVLWRHLWSPVLTLTPLLLL